MRTRRNAARTSRSSPNARSGTMRISDFELYRYSLPLVEPVKLSAGTIHHREGLLLKLDGDDGSIGWGESAPLPGFSAESLDETEESLQAAASSLTGYELQGDTYEIREKLNAELERLKLPSSVRFGCELAVWNLCAASQGISLVEWMFPKSRRVVPLNGLLFGAAEDVLEGASRMREDGYSAVKLKVGKRSVEEDIELVHALRGALGEDIRLRLDANRAWSFEKAVRFGQGIVEVGIEYVEEPLADASLLPDLTRESSLPLALDESLVGMDPGSLEQHCYAVAVVLKPTLIGGLSKTLRIAETASRLGMSTVISSVYESGIGISALIALAAGVGDQAVPAGLDTYRALAADVLSPPLELPAPEVDVRASFGVRREVDEWALDPIR